MAKVVRIDAVLEEVGMTPIPIRASLSVDESQYSSAYEVADGTVDGAISLGPITTASVFFIATDTTITYKLNGSATATTLTANGADLLFNTPVTALTVSNASGSTATLRIGFWGT